MRVTSYRLNFHHDWVRWFHEEDKERGFLRLATDNTDSGDYCYFWDRHGITVARASFKGSDFTNLVASCDQLEPFVDWMLENAVAPEQQQFANELAKLVASPAI